MYRILLFVAHSFVSFVRKITKATTSFVMSVRLSVSVRKEQLGSHWTDFHDPTLYFPSNANTVKKRRVIKTF